MRKIALDCGKCGGALEVTEDMEMFKCPYCGTPYMVERSEGTVKIVKLERRVEQLEVEQRQIRSSVASIELKELLAERKELEEQFKQEGLKSRDGYWAGGAFAGVLVTIVLVLIDIQVFGGVGALFCVGLAAPPLGIVWGARQWEDRVHRPHREAMAASRAKEAELRAVIERS